MVYRLKILMKNFPKFEVLYRKQCLMTAPYPHPRKGFINNYADVKSAPRARLGENYELRINFVIVILIYHNVR